MLVDKTVAALIDAFRAPSPTPGGGSAAALRRRRGAALLEMVAAMPRTRSGAESERQALDAALPAIRDLRSALTSLIDRDAAAYDAVVAAYRLPRTTDEEQAARKAAVKAAMRVAIDVPLETARAAMALVPHARTVAESGNPNARSDIGMAISLLMAAYAGGRMNVEINLPGLGDEAFAARVHQELHDLMREASTLLGPMDDALGVKHVRVPGAESPIVPSTES